MRDAFPVVLVLLGVMFFVTLIGIAVANEDNHGIRQMPTSDPSVQCFMLGEDHRTFNCVRR